MAFSWTDDLLSSAMKMRADGMSASQIASRLVDEYGRSPSRCAVIGKLYRAELGALDGGSQKPCPSVLWTPERIEAMLWLVDQGLTGIECADRLTRQFGVPFSRHAVYYKALKLGIKFSHGRRTFQRRSPVLRVQPSVLGAANQVPKPTGAAGCGLLDLTSFSCRWIEGDPSGDHHYCGEMKVHGAYCAYHAAMAYQPAATRQSRPAAPDRARRGPDSSGTWWVWT